MSDSVYIGLGARQLEDSPEYQPISCVKLTIGGEDASGNPIVCQAGNPNSGRTIETSNPLIWDATVGNTVAQNILSAAQGYRYKPFQADGAIINPAIEIGDAVEVGDVYSVIADIETSFTPLMSANISAPQGSDIDHEYPYESSENRELIQQIQGLKTSFIVENGRIAAEISDVQTTAQGLTTKITSLEATVNGIHAYTDQEIRTISGGVVHDWAEINFTPESIKSQVSSYFDEAGAADGAYDAAEEYANRLVEPIAGEYTSAIEQSAKDIKATVAASETIWNVYSLSQTEQNKFAVYGYGAPSDENSQSNKTRPSAYNGKYYLDQATGVYYRSNGSTWTRQGAISEKLAVSQQAAINTSAGKIESLVSDVSSLGTRVSTIEQTPSDITLSVYSDDNGKTYFKLSDGQAELSTPELYLNVNAANVKGTITANEVRAGATITSPTITGGTIKSTRFADPNNVAYLTMGNETWSDGYLWYGPSSVYYPTRSNSYFWVRSYLNFVELAAGGASFMGTQQGSSLYNLYGMWNFEQCTRVVMPDGTVFARS